MQTECPICSEWGSLQKVNPRFYRMRHYIGKHPTKISKERTRVSMFSYCRVSTEWALKQIAHQEEIDKWYLK